MERDLRMPWLVVQQPTDAFLPAGLARIEVAILLSGNSFLDKNLGCSCIGHC